MRRTLLAALAVIALLFTSGCFGGDSRLADAHEEINKGSRLADDGQALILDMKGEEDVLGMDVYEIVEYLHFLDTPQAVVNQMDRTRALDGFQTASWDGLVAQWSFHPNTGLDIILSYE